jgi:hypothetical protein
VVYPLIDNEQSFVEKLTVPEAEKCVQANDSLLSSRELPLHTILSQMNCAPDLTSLCPEIQGR